VIERERGRGRRGEGERGFAQLRYSQYSGFGALSVGQVVHIYARMRLHSTFARVPESGIPHGISV